jgi:hypothetical protein
MNEHVASHARRPYARRSVTFPTTLVMHRILAPLLAVLALARTGAAQPSDPELLTIVTNALHFAGANIPTRDLLECARSDTASLSVYDARTRSTISGIRLAYWTLPEIPGFPEWEVPISPRGVRGGLAVSVVRHSEHRFTLTFSAEHCGSRTLVSEAAYDGTRRHYWTWHSALLAVIADALDAASRDREVRDIVQCAGFGRAAALITPDPDLRLGVEVPDHMRLNGPTTELVPLTPDARSVSGLRIVISTDPAGEYSVRFSGGGRCAADRLLKVRRAESGTWVAAWVEDVDQYARACREDKDCEAWRLPASESQCPAPYVCHPTSMTWERALSAWVGSRGRCAVGSRCWIDSDCPAGLVCDVYDRVYTDTGRLAAPLCRPEVTDHLVNCTRFDRDCASASRY